jgi:Tfp pilus assembly protein PilN
METTEVALANLARSSLKLDSDKITTIIYIEDDFTRLIFLRGGDLFHVSSVIHENADSPNILEVIYRRLLYEQDEAQIPEITTVLLAGKSNRIKAKDFFTAHLHDTTVSYLSSEMLSNFHSNEAQRATFSEFAVPIALAWKLLNPRHQAFIPVNLLPQDFIDQQKVLKLSYHGYLLLAVTGLVAFFFTWQILKMRSQINTARSQNSQLELKIRTNQTTVDRVLELEEQCKRLRKNLALSDSLSKGHDELLAFLQKLNASVEKAGSLWVDEIAKHKDGFAVKGTSLSREKIPIFAEALEQASLRKVTRDEGGSRKLFRFDMERRIASGSFQFSDNGVRIIDVNKFMNDRSLILTKEGPQPNSMAAEAMKSAPEKSTTEQWNSSERQSQKSVRSTTDSESTTRRNVRSTGIVKEAALTRPVTDEPRLAENHESAPATREQEDKPRSDHPKSQPGFAAVTADGITERIENQIVPVTASTNVTAQPAFQRVNGITEAGKPNPMNDEVAEQPKTQPVVTSPQVESSEIYRGYSIQAASSSTRDLAQQYAAAYRKQGYDTAVEKYFDTSKGMYRYRVLVGIFASRAAAEKKAEQMTGLLMPDYRIIGLK